MYELIYIYNVYMITHMCTYIIHNDPYMIVRMHKYKYKSYIYIYLPFIVGSEIWKFLVSHRVSDVEALTVTPASTKDLLMFLKYCRSASNGVGPGARNKPRGDAA